MYIYTVDKRCITLPLSSVCGDTRLSPKASEHFGPATSFNQFRQNVCRPSRMPCFFGIELS